MKNTSFITKHNVDLSNEELIETCTLYQAVRWIAFNEKPLHSSFSSILLPHYDESDWYGLKDSDLSLLERACNFLRLKLFKGELEANGHIWKSAGHINKKFKLSPPFKIPPPIWCDRTAEHEFIELLNKEDPSSKIKEVETSYCHDTPFIDIRCPDAWIEKEVMCLINTIDFKLYNYENVKEQKKSIFCITINTSALLKVFSPKNLDNFYTEKKGRPKGSGVINDDIELGYMHALITEKNINPHQAANLAINHFGQKGASEEADIKRFR